MIDESSEVKAVPEVAKEQVTSKKIDMYVEAFKQKRKDSNDYKEALNSSENISMTVIKKV